MGNIDIAQMNSQSQGLNRLSPICGFKNTQKVYLSKQKGLLHNVTRIDPAGFS